MDNLDIATREGSVTTVPGAAVEARAGGVRGELLLPGSPGYDTARDIEEAMSRYHSRWNQGSPQASPHDRQGELPS